MMSIDGLWESVIAVLLSVVGGTARLLNTNEKIKINWGRILSEIVFCGFAGMMALLSVRALELPGEYWPGLVCGMVGWGGPKAVNWLWTLALNIIWALAAKVLGLDINEISKK